MSNGNGNAPAKGRAIELLPQGPALAGLLSHLEPKLERVLPKHLTPTRLTQVLSTMIYKAPDLQRCTKDSVILGIMTAAELGLDLAPSSGEAYLVPYWNSKVGAKEAQFQPGYKGLVKLARQSGEIASLRAEVVREGEEFVYAFTPDLEFRHVPALGSTAEVVAAYAVAKLRNGEYQIAVLTVDEIEAIRRRSKAGKDGPWVTDWIEMAKKTAIRRLCKLLPRSLELDRAIEADEVEYEQGPSVVVSRPPGVVARGSAALASRLASQAPALEPSPPPPQLDDDEPQPIEREPGSDD